MVLSVSGFAAGVPAAEPQKAVLALYGSRPDLPANVIVDEIIRSTLERELGPRLDFYAEYIDTTRWPEAETQSAVHDFLRRRYERKKLSVIIAVAQPAINFIRLYGDELFPGVPIVVYGPLDALRDWEPGRPIAGMLGKLDLVGTVQLILRLQPSTREILIISGASPTDQWLQSIARSQLEELEKRVKFTFLTGVAVEDLVKTVTQVPDGTAILFLSMLQDSAGNNLLSHEVLAHIANVARVPVYSQSGTNVGRGTVGGVVFNPESLGREAAQLTLRVLRGERIQDLPVQESTSTVPMVDWRQLRRWGLNEKNLPPGSIVLNRQPTVWNLYKRYIVSAVCLLLVQTSLIVGLLRQRAIRRKAEADLTLTYDRLRLAVEAGKAVSWDSDAQSNRLRWFGDLRTMFGIPSDAFEGQVEDFYRHVYPDDRESVRSAVADARRSHGPYAEEFRVIRDDQAVRWVTAKGKFYYKNDGEAEQMVGMAFDITDRKLAEQQVRESEDRLAGIVGTAMDAIIAIDEEQRIVLFNAAAEKMFGCLAEDAFGTTIDRFIPERFRRKHAEHIEAFHRSGVTSRLMSSRGVLWAVRTNGVEFPIEASISHTESDGKRMFTVTIRDISERLRAENALSSIGSRLIEAHEEERTWIGRELHDDINQKLAMLAIEMDAWKQADSREKFSEHLRHAKKRIMDLSMDVQALSHRLHSSKLEYLGLVVAAGSFCKEVSEKTKVDVQFSHSAVPSTMPKEVSLCLFRVLQEAVQNAIKYSGVSRFHVNLRRTSDGLELTVADEGKGFVERVGFSGHGLGLISMRERLQIVHGVLEIKTKPGAGTTIIARVPLQSAELLAIAG